MRKLILLLLPSFCFAAVQGLQSNGTYPGYAGLNLPNTAPWTTLGASTQPWRLEVRVFGSLSGGLTQLPGLVLGTIQLFGNGNSVVAGTNYQAEQFSGPAIYNCCEGHNDLLIRVQRDVANNQYTLEAQDPSNNYNSLGYATGAITTYGATSWVAYPIQVTVGQNIYAFIRWYSTVVPRGTPIGINDNSADLAFWSAPGVNTSAGTATDSVHSLVIKTQIAVSLSLTNAPVYPPVCSPGAQQTVPGRNPTDAERVELHFVRGRRNSLLPMDAAFTAGDASQLVGCPAINHGFYGRPAGFPIDGERHGGAGGDMHGSPRRRSDGCKRRGGAAEPRAVQLDRPLHAVGKRRGRSIQRSQSMAVV